MCSIWVLFVSCKCALCHLYTTLRAQAQGMYKDRGTNLEWRIELLQTQRFCKLKVLTSPLISYRFITQMCKISLWCRARPTPGRCPAGSGTTSRGLMRILAAYHSSLTPRFHGCPAGYFVRKKRSGDKNSCHSGAWHTSRSTRGWSAFQSYHDFLRTQGWSLGEGLNWPSVQILIRHFLTDDKDQMLECNQSVSATSLKESFSTSHKPKELQQDHSDWRIPPQDWGQVCWHLFKLNFLTGRKCSILFQAVLKSFSSYKLRLSKFS